MTKFWKVQPADRPVLSINGVREGDRLRLELEAGAGSGHDHAVAAPGNWEDILEAVLALRGAIGRAATYSPNNFAVLEDGERRVAIADIAALGHALFLALVPEGTPLRSFFESIGRSPATRHVIVRGAATFVPWEFLYAHPVLPGEEVRPELFAAHNVVFSSVVSTSGPLPHRAVFDLTPADPLQDIPGDGRLVEAGRVSDDRLESLAEPEQWFTAHGKLLRVRDLAPLSPEAPRDGEVGKLLAFLGGNADIYHFDCDAKPTHGGARNDIRVSTNFALGRRDVEGWDFTGNVDVLLFLNFCSSHASPTWDLKSIAAKLQSRYAGAVIAVLSDVNDMTAWLFAREFYASLLSSASVGDALLAARRSLLRLSHGNPAAFMFSMFGAPGLRPAGALSATT